MSTEDDKAKGEKLMVPKKAGGKKSSTRRSDRSEQPSVIPSDAGSAVPPIKNMPAPEIEGSDIDRSDEEIEELDGDKANPKVMAQLQAVKAKNTGTARPDSSVVVADDDEDKVDLKTEGEKRAELKDRLQNMKKGADDDEPNEVD